MHWTTMVFQFTTGRGKHCLIELNSMNLIFFFYCRDNKIELDSIVGCIPQVRSNEIVVDPELKENADSYNLIFRFLNPIQRQCQRLSLKI